MQCRHCGADIADGSRFCGTCGTDQTDGAGPRTTGGTTADLFARLTALLAGRYRLESMVGRGGMGAVFRAEDLTLERPVAIKVLPPEMSHDESFVERFQREARTAAKLDHPGIIPIYAVESREDLHYFVMKFVTGRGLDQVLETGPMPFELVQRILWQAATALGHAHQRGVIHRDIKPANIMLEEGDRTILTDFGISKAMQAATQLTATGQVIGTPHYMSPEQAKGGHVDGRSDQYSLAMVGYRMLAGRLPFRDDSVHTILYKQIFEDPPRLDEIDPDLPPFLVTAIHRALQKEPADRFATMEEFATAVWPAHPVAAPAGVRSASGQRITGPSITDAPTEITPDTPAPPGATRKSAAAPGRRTRPVAGIAAGIVLLAAVGGGVGWYLLGAGEGGAGPAAEAPDTAGAVPQETTATVPGAPLARADTAAPPAVDPAPSRPDSTRTGPRRSPPRRQQPAEDPAAVSPPVRRTGELSINATPFGTVILDGVELGDTPIVNHEVAVGRHVIRIVREGYVPVVDTVTVLAGQRLRKGYPLVRRDP